jgi:3'-phosphoadenosine 5'-phosphosulfate sulfotransferase (PAPS reductase)/FAD synthetase
MLHPGNRCKSVDRLHLRGTSAADGSHVRGRQVEPMRRALDELGIIAWLTGRRRSQGGERTELRLFEIDEGDGRLKINPLANWGREEVWRYIKREAVPPPPPPPVLIGHAASLTPY